MVVKRDCSRQIFDSNKLLAGLLRACEKRPVPVEVLEELVDSLEQGYINEAVREVTSRELGEQVLKRLKCLDKVAYIRFASVYRDFSDIDTFMEELRKLQEESSSDV